MKNTGTLVIAPLRPYDSNDQFASAYANEIQGGHHQVVDLSSRDAIPAGRRVEGMLCWVISAATSYRLISGIENINWVEETSGDPVGGGEFSLTASGTCTTEDIVGNCVYEFSPVTSGLYDVRTANPTELAKAAIGLIVSKDSDTTCLIQFFGEVEGVYGGLSIGNLWLDIDGTITNLIPIAPPSGVFLQKIGNAVSTTRFILSPEKPWFRRLP